jgi:hypothetical protein
MKKTHKQLGQYISENHNYEGSAEEFLEETAPLIGFIVHAFNSLDAQLNSSICSIINDRTDLLGTAVIYKMNFSGKIDLFFRLVRSMELAFGNTLPSFQKLIEDLRKCASLRNAVVHAEWENLDAEGYTYVKLNFDKDGMKQHYWQFTPDSLEVINDLISQTYNSFEKYEDEMQKIFHR